MSSPWDTYARELEHFRHGYPLWDPEPSFAGEVHIGDVGYIEEGQFHRLFNVAFGKEHPYNAGGVPEHFQPMDIPEGLFRHGGLTDAIIASQGVEKSDIEAAISMYVYNY